MDNLLFFYHLLGIFFCLVFLQFLHLDIGLLTIVKLPRYSNTSITIFLSDNDENPRTYMCGYTREKQNDLGLFALYFSLFFFNAQFLLFFSLFRFLISKIYHKKNIRRQIKVESENKYKRMEKRVVFVFAMQFFSSSSSFCFFSLSFILMQLCPSSSAIV